MDKPSPHTRIWAAAKRPRRRIYGTYGNCSKRDSGWNPSHPTSSPSTKGVNIDKNAGGREALCYTMFRLSWLATLPLSPASPSLPFRIARYRFSVTSYGSYVASSCPGQWLSSYHSGLALGLPQRTWCFSTSTPSQGAQRSHSVVIRA